MKKIVLILLCVGLPVVVTGQDFSVSVSPYSFEFWGQVPGTASACNPPSSMVLILFRFQLGLGDP